MMIHQKSVFKFYILLLVFIFMVSACGGNETEPTATPETAVSEAEPTNLPQPTSPPEPTAEPEPTPTPEPEIELGDALRSEEGGFAIAEVPGWTTEEFFGIMSLSPSDAHDEYGPNIIIISGLNDEAKEIDEAFDEIMTELSLDEDSDLEITETAEASIAGVPARSATIAGPSEDGEVDIIGRITVALITPEHSFVIFGFAPDDQWEEIESYYTALLNTVSFFEPTAVDFGLEDEMIIDGVEIRQWATAAFASSQFTDAGWAASQANGAPNTPECGDIDTAWASASSDGVDWLELYYDEPVYATEINIYETNSPDQVVSVELIDGDGNAYNVYVGFPYVEEICPYVLSIPVDLEVLVHGVRITVDQSELPWTEIDAVELVGISPNGDVTESTEEFDEVAFETPEGFLWRAERESGLEEGMFSALGSLDVDRNGFLYITDNIHGIWIYDSEGNFLEVINHSDFNNVQDVYVGWDGTIYATSWGNNSIFVMDPNGNILNQFGTEGNGPSEFGTFSPASVTADLLGNIYVLDDNEDASGERFSRIQVFDGSGNFQFEWVIEDDFFSATAIQYWASPTGDDRIFVLGFLGANILEYDLDGNFIRSFGEEALDFGGPQDIDIDEAGNFYVTMWTPATVVKLDHDGNLLAQWGIEIEEDEGGLPAGGLYQPTGVAVSLDGSQVYVSEWTGDFSYVTAFEFR